MWLPERVIFEEQALDYRRGQDMLACFQHHGVPVDVLARGARVRGIQGSTPLEVLKSAKKTLVVRVYRGKKFQECRPSAHYQLPLASSCPGRCEYCYLYTNLGKKPYLRTYVNLEEILQRASTYIEEGLPDTTVFEGSATSDPVPLEPFTRSLEEAILFFGSQGKGRFRFVTKFTGVDSLLHLQHNNHTRFRFSVNTERVIREFEHGTPGLQKRLNALVRVISAGYPAGIVIAPVILDRGWKEDYGRLLSTLAAHVPSQPPVTLEIILHRFTLRARSAIESLYPGSRLPLKEEGRRFKYGQFGYGKFLYPGDLYREAETFFLDRIQSLMPSAKIEYLV